MTVIVFDLGALSGMRIKNFKEILLLSKNVTVIPFTHSTSLHSIYLYFSSIYNNKIIIACSWGTGHVQCQKLHAYYVEPS